MNVRFKPAWLVVAAVAFFFWEARTVPPHLDDAFISYRYARNLVEAHGLVYNVGERVEGITNLLWTLLVALGLKTGLDAKLAAHLLGVASGAGLLVLSHRFARRLGAPTWIAALAPCLLVSALPFAVWSLSGMETPLFAALALLTLLLDARDRLGWTTACAFAATLTRPEGALLAACVFGVRAVRRRADARTLGWAGAFALLLTGLTVARLAYYGSPLPNTFYAKAEPSWLRGLAYLYAFLSEGAWVLIPAALAALRDFRTWPAAAFALALVAFVVSVGGDAFAHGRLLLPTQAVLVSLACAGAASLPRQSVAGRMALASLAASWAWSVLGPAAWPLVACAAVLAVSIGARPRVRRTAFAAAALAGLAWAGTWISNAEEEAHLPRTARSRSLAATHHANRLVEAWGLRNARVLERRPQRNPLVAAGAIGALGYYSGLPILDIYGLVDPAVARHGTAFPLQPEDPTGLWERVREIFTGATLHGRIPGHHRTNLAYLFERRPDYILIPELSSLLELERPVLVAIHRSPEFARDYVPDPEVGGYRRRNDR